MIDSFLFCYLYEVFPDSFSAKRNVENYDYIPGPWGTEKVFSGYKEEILSECILNTANAISRGGKCTNDAIKYIDTFRSKKIQKQELKRYN